jgi:predicted membrane protein
MVVTRMSLRFFMVVRMGMMVVMALFSIKLFFILIILTNLLYCMAVIMTVWARTVIMMMKIMEKHKPDHIHQKAKNTYSDQTRILDFHWLKNPLNTLTKDVIRDKNKENGIEKSTESFNFAITIGIFGSCCWNLSHI